VNRLNAEAQKVMKTPEFGNVLKETGSDYVGDTPENFGKFIQLEQAKWEKQKRDPRGKAFDIDASGCV
jgi:tripartite-type tricarboxylate transporter receptor subunit TctC